MITPAARPLITAMNTPVACSAGSSQWMANQAQMAISTLLM